MPERVLIQYDACRMVLYLPAFFDGSSLANIRKAFKLLSERPHQNAPAFETFDRFFPAWEQYLKQQLESDTQEKKEAEQTARATESQVAYRGAVCRFSYSKGRSPPILRSTSSATLCPLRHRL